MPDFNLRSDAVNVEQIMEQIRARIREKRGVDYTEAQIREMASVKLEKFLDPRGVRSDLLEQYRRAQPPYAPPELPNYAFEADTLFTSTRGPLRFIRRLLLPILKLFFNPNPLIQALNIQSTLNATLAEREAKRDAARFAFDQLHYEVMHNLVIETTRLGIEVKNLTMRLESLTSRLEFSERRARALESVVMYKPSAEERSGRQDDGRRDEGRRDESRRDDSRRDESRREGRRQEQRRPEPQAQTPQQAAQPARPADAVRPAAPPQAQPAEALEGVPVEPDTAAAVDGQAGTPEGPGQRSRRRRRRRGRRGSGSAAALMGAGQPGTDGPHDTEQAGDDAESDMDAAAASEASVADVDSRTARPEPFEHAFGAQAHPAEQAASDPAHTPTPAAPIPAREGHPQEEQARPAEPTPVDPSVTPEQ